MKNTYILNRILLLLLCVGAFLAGNAQSAKPVHRWHSTNKEAGITADSFKSSPEADYTPANDINSWEAKAKLNEYAKSGGKNLSMSCILTVDEAGKITSIKTIKTNNKAVSDAVAAILKNTKTAGPSYIHNQAVTSYVPCAITITKNQITIL